MDDGISAVPWMKESLEVSLGRWIHIINRTHTQAAPHHAPHVVEVGHRHVAPIPDEVQKFGVLAPLRRHHVPAQVRVIGPPPRLLLPPPVERGEGLLLVVVGSPSVWAPGAVRLEEWAVLRDVPIALGFDG